MSIKIFCDIAELKVIKKFNKKKIVKGFTTNPSLMRKAGAKDYKSYSKKILKICNNKPVSLEVFADEYSEMKIQAVKINTWGKNVYVKVFDVAKFLDKAALVAKEKADAQAREELEELQGLTGGAT